MMLYIKQKVFSCADRFTVKDETGVDRYYVEGEFLSLGKSSTCMICKVGKWRLSNRNNASVGTWVSDHKRR